MVIDGLKIDVRRGLAQLVEHAGLGSNKHLILRLLLGLGDHLPGRKHVHAILCHQAFVGQVQRGIGAPALRVDIQVRVRVILGLLG